MRSRTGFSIIVAGLRPLGVRVEEVPRSSRKRFSSARWVVMFAGYLGRSLGWVWGFGDGFVS